MSKKFVWVKLKLIFVNKFAYFSFKTGETSYIYSLDEPLIAPIRTSLVFHNYNQGVV